MNAHDDYPVDCIELSIELTARDILLGVALEEIPPSGKVLLVIVVQSALLTSVAGI